MSAPTMNKYGQIDQTVGFQAEKTYLKHAMNKEVLGKFGVPAFLSKKSGNQIHWQRKKSLAPIRVALVEGQAPSGTVFQYEKVIAEIKQFGAWMPITDQVVDLHENNVTKDMIESQGEQAGITAEMVMWDVITNGTSVTYAGGKTQRVDVVDTLDASMIRHAQKMLRRMKGTKFTQVAKSTPQYGTKSVESAYIAVCHTDCEDILRALPGFKLVADYGTGKTVCDDEFGQFEQTRIVTSPEFDSILDAGGVTGATGMESNGGANVNIYQMIVLAKESFGHIAVRGEKFPLGGPIKPIVRQPGNATPGDELGQTGSIAWKMYFNAKILNDTWLERLEFTVPA